MNPSLIVYNVPNGKTRFAERIAKFYGLRLYKKEFKVGQWAWEEGWLYITRQIIPNDEYVGLAKSFREVADEINAAIPLTDWQEGEPPLIGEYLVYDHEGGNKSWWHGDCWSYGILYGYSQKFKNIAAGKRQDNNWRPRWRGLAEEPIVID